MAATSSKRVFGELEKRTSATTGKVTGWRARYTGPDLARHPNTFGDTMAAEAWLNVERILIDRGEWNPPKVREREARLAEQRAVTLRERAYRSIGGKTLRPSTVYRYKTALEKRILPALGDIPLADLTRTDVTSWYTTLRVRLAEEARGRTWQDLTDLIVALDPDNAGRTAAARVRAMLTPEEAAHAQALDLLTDPAQTATDDPEQLATALARTIPLTWFAMEPNLQTIRYLDHFERQIPMLRALVDHLYGRVELDQW